MRGLLTALIMMSLLLVVSGELRAAPILLVSVIAAIILHK